ncbi:unnamed protein product [Candidula unifasciata]|uniref:Uncharacterized protein n=1 Tax=Candidula unifasciata TaxID=100452 RepID=A0A8S3YSX8_9EUPU|nr:unnamed protein product [Candidula unifasciata]
MKKLLISNFALVAMALQLAEPGRAPVIRTQGSTLKAIPGKKVYMACEASGDPQPTITWEREGMPVSLFGNRFSVTVGSEALRIVNLLVDDRGNYSCIAKNPFGVDIITVTLVVMIKPECKIISPTNLTLIELTNQELVCRSRGLPQPSFEWLTNHHQRIRPMKFVFDNMTTSTRLYSVERQIDEEMFESVLFLQPVLFKDLGDFVCVSFNEVGSSRDTVALDVHFPPKVVSSHQPQQPVSWWLGHTANLTCAVTGNHLPEITWTRDGQRFSCTALEEWVRGSEIISTCMIKDKNTGGPGNYTCSAENSLGKILVHTFIVREIFPPPEVEILPFISGPDEVSLSVAVPPKEDSPTATQVLVSYRWYAENDGKTPVNEHTADVDDQGKATVKLLDISGGRDYLVTVQARNIVGSGPSTTIIVNREMPLDKASLQPPAKKPTCILEAGEESYNPQLNSSNSSSPGRNHNPNNTEYNHGDTLEYSRNKSLQISLEVTASHNSAMIVLPGQRSCLSQCSCLVCLVVLFSGLFLLI